MTEKKQEIVGLQHLRGLAAIGVVLDHASGMIGFPKYFGSSPADGLFASGAVGVDIFFLISGFIISAVSLDVQRRPKISRRRFFVRRFFRIVPLMWLAVISYATLRVLGRGEFSAWPFVRALSLFPYSTVEPNNIWTLRHEFLFYILFAISFLGARRRVYVIAAWLVSPFVCAALLSVAGLSGAIQAMSVVASPVNIEFGAGLAIGLFWRPKAALRTRVDPLIVLLAGFALLATVAHFLDYRPDNVAQVSVIALCCVPILCAGIAIECPPSFLRSFGELLGGASYAIYLFHLHFLSALIGIWARMAPSTPRSFVLFGVSICAVAGGVALHILLERPLLRRIKTLQLSVRPTIEHS